MREYMVVAFLDDFKPGDQMVDWPLHITIVPWMALYDPSKFRAEARKMVKNIGSIVTTVGDLYVWGPNKVNLLDYSVPLHRVHEQLLRLARSRGRLLVREQHMGRDFTPHITHQKNRAAESGRRLKIDTVYIIEKDVNQRLKTVKAKIKLV